MKTRFLSCATVALMVAAFGISTFAQSRPGAPAPAGPTFPPTGAANFTAPQPTKADVNAFLHTSWGYDPNRVWEVYSIEKTVATGISKVIVIVGEKPHPQTQELSFFVTPDGHHLIAQNAIMDFGPHPYAANYRTLQQRADGPSMGSKSKQFELVEFADFECPHCREAQPIVHQLVKDFPQARYVFQYFPLVTIHPMAMKAAEFAACVRQQSGDAAFFKYADAVFQAQPELEGKDGELALRNAATGVGLDADKVAACANSPAGEAPVKASLQLGSDLHVDETPTLFIDGRAVPMMGIPYPELKKIIEWQFNLDKGSE